VFDLIATVLAWFYQLVPNYAAAIAMMTILIMLLLTPLTLKSTKSMLELQRIQPEMKRIQQAHKGDRQAMNEELMALYKEHKVNPLGGCLPLLIQAPIWIVMFRVFRGLTYIPPGGTNFQPKYLDHSTQLYQDLSQTNDMNAFGLNLATSAARSLQESFVTALPYLMLVAIVVATYFVQQRQITARNKNNPTVNDSPAAAQQQMIMKIFPIFSGVFAFIVPAALAWYFLVQNVFRIGQQAYITKRFYREHPDAVAARQAASAKAAPNGKAATAKPTPKTARNAGGSSKPAPSKATPPKSTPAKATEPKDKARPAPTPSSNGKRREAPKPPPRPTGSTPKPPARPRPQQKKKP
jgi:YidC/Oxa1 family membrane protein insertase